MENGQTIPLFTELRISEEASLSGGVTILVGGAGGPGGPGGPGGAGQPGQPGQPGYSIVITGGSEEIVAPAQLLLQLPPLPPLPK